MSSRAPLWRPVEVVDVALHEWAHALIQRVEGAHVGHPDWPRLAQLASATAARRTRDQTVLVERLKDKLFVATVCAGLSTSLLLLLAVMLVHK